MQWGEWNTRLARLGFSETKDREEILSMAAEQVLKGLSVNRAISISVLEFKLKTCTSVQDALNALENILVIDEGAEERPSTTKVDPYG